MEQRILESLSGKAAGEYILPFFWQHGEEKSVLKEEIDAIQNSGINEFCVESRTHEQFCEEKWWQDFGFLLEEAKERGMRVWLLDDRYYPTGYANNYIETHPELRAVRLRMEYRDFAGPQTGTALLPVSLDEDECFVSIMAYRRAEKGNLLLGEGIQLMPMLKDGLIWWDIPEGFWCVYYIVRTRRVTASWYQNYIDKMSEESCKAMLHAVYEPHYEHFKEYFGNTFAGFFSDEPGFVNETGYDSVLGREEMHIPWNDSMLASLAEKTGLEPEEVQKLLPALWHEIEGFTSAVREAYMEIVSETYSRNVCWLLGDWCRSHGVMYIGHVIEDFNAHQRLGLGVGHFFRALDGQDMGGCDIVLHQIIPGYTQQDYKIACGSKRAEPAFFSYTLPKLASSHAHIQPLKKGRAMCEIYGAFGWAEGLPEMKYLTDLMLVSGINYFVPHAFTPKYPDDDCPPHFYARGMNTQYPLFGQLMGYMQRMSHVLTGGIHQADVAVYYNAEAEWAGGRYMLQQEVCSELTRHQVDFDLIPQDIICGASAVENGRLVIHEETYGLLIIPYSQYLPEKVLAAFEQLAAKGLLVWFVENYPDLSSENHPIGGIRELCETVSLEELCHKIETYERKSIRTQKDYPSLRSFHIKRNGHDIFMLWNDDIFTEIDTEIDFPVAGRAVFYDAWKNRVFAAEQSCAGNSGNRVRVRLAPSEAIVLCFGEWKEELSVYDYRDQQLQELNLKWEVSVCQAKDMEFTKYPIEGLKNLAPGLPHFSGVIRYEAVWNIENPEAIHVLELSSVGETAQLWVNGDDCGAVVGKPYRFLIDGRLQPGENRLCIEVMSNLAYRERDWLSTFLPLPSIGLTGAVYVG